MPSPHRGTRPARPRAGARRPSIVRCMAVLLTAAFLLSFAPSAAAQTRPAPVGAAPPSADSAAATTGAADTAGRAQTPGQRVARPSKLPLVFYGGTAAALGLVAATGFDADSGGYRDGWGTFTRFPDKAVHGLAAWAITNVGIDLGVRPGHAAVAVCAAGAAYEVIQGYVSPYDLVADCVGAGGAALWQAWRAKSRAKSRAKARRQQ